MRKLLIATVASIALSASSALAADLAPYMKAPPPPPAPTLSWTGCYIDAGAGYGLWNQDHWVSFGPPAPIASNVSTTDGGRGWLGRFGGGCDYQLGGGLSNFVVGAFADYDVMDLKGTISLNDIYAGSPLAANEKERDAWYAGGRVGYLITPSVLGFVSGGWTETKFSSLSEYFTSTGAAAGFSYPSHTYQGWFLGGGYEYALNFSWLPIHGLFWKTEYRYSYYDSANLPEITSATGLADGNVLHSKKDVQTITSSLVWRFNFGR